MWCHVIKTVKRNVNSWGILNFSPSLTWWVYFTKWWSFIFFPGTPGILTYFWHLLRFLMYYQIHSWHWWIFIIKVGARSLHNFYSITDLIPCGDCLSKEVLLSVGEQLSAIMGQAFQEVRHLKTGLARCGLTCIPACSLY